MEKAESQPRANPAEDVSTHSGTTAERDKELDEERKKVHGLPNDDSGREDDDGDEPAEPTMETSFGETLNKKASVNDVSAIPNGGTRAWLQVLGSFFLFCNTWGIINTYGALQTYYETELLKSSSPSAISWIGSIQSFLLLIVGALTGPIYDAGHLRVLLITGTFLVVFGTMMLSLCHVYWQVLLAQAFCVGIGCGCLFVPSVAILSTYFTTRVSLAVGISAAGSSLGGVIYPIMFHELQPKIGFPWAIRIWGFLILACLIIPILVMKMRVYPSSKRPIVDIQALKHMPFTVFLFGAFLGFVGLYCPFFYIQLFDIDHSITDPKLIFYLLSIINAASIFGRIVPNFFADKIGSFNVIVPCALISGILCICLIPIRTTGPLILFCILYGFFTGSFVSLPPSVIISLSPNRGLIGTHMGMGFAAVSVGILIGTPCAGAILDNHGFSAVWIFGGVMTISGAAVMWVGRVLKVGPRLLVKA